MSRERTDLVIQDDNAEKEVVKRVKKKTDDSTPIISIVVPVYNQSLYIKPLLESVIKQTLEEIEVIVVNDGSTDNSMEIINEYVALDPRIKVIDKINEGYGKAVNTGISNATGKYIGIVEGDDFIAETMYETLYDLTFDETVDVVKGNFWDYYEYDDGKTIPDVFVNQERVDMPDVEEPFNIRQRPEILWGHPSVWSAIYKRSFLKKSNIVFMEVRGGGWVDNPFFFETLCKAKYVMWTKEPLYYYRKTNAKSSSNKQTNPALPFQRMHDNLDILESNSYTDDISYRYAYARALMYLRGAFAECNYEFNYDIINEYAKKLMQRCDSSIIRSDFNLQDQYLYNTYASPMKSISAKFPKILIYNWLPYDNQWGWGGGVTIYCRNLIDVITKKYPGVQIYFLSSGFAYSAEKAETYVRKIASAYGDSCHQFEIVNSPVPAEQRNLYVNPLVAIKNENLKKVFSEFIKQFGPFESIHFNNIEGLSLDVLDLKEECPSTKFIYSIHNYVPMCITGSYYQRHKHCNCNPNHTADDCIKCTHVEIKRDIAKITYERGLYGIEKSKVISQKRWLKTLDLEKLDDEVTSKDILKFSKVATEKINKNCDHILAVSKRVYDIAAQNGFDESKMSVSYIGTVIAQRQVRRSLAEVKDGLKIVFLGNDINYEEKGYPFLLEALEQMDVKYASQIDFVLTVRQPEHAEIYTMLKNFRSVKVIQGYTHNDLKWILEDCNLSLVPVLWEDNLPQIAIESVAYGVPVLASNCGGASELCDSDLFRFEGGNAENLLDKIAHFVEDPTELDEYWKHHNGLVTMVEHWNEMREYYGLPESAPVIEINQLDYAFLLYEHQFLHEHISLKDDKYTPNPILNDLRERLRVSEDALRIERERVAGMENQKGKIVFQTECLPIHGEVGADLFKIELNKFEYNNFCAEIKFIRCNNEAPASHDTLWISGTLYKDKDEDQDEVNYRMEIQQIDWDKDDIFVVDWIYFYVKENAVYCFAKHNGQYSGFAYEVMSLVTRNNNNAFQFEKLNEGFIFKNELCPVDVFNAIEEE